MELRVRRSTFLPLIFLLAILFTGCSTYSGSLRPVQDDVIMGENEQAISFLNEALGVSQTSELPSDLKDGRVLLLLERATLLQSMGEYEQAARDMSFVDERMEYLDIDAYDRVEIAKWLFSDDAEKYRAPAYERLLLNVFNVVNFLATKNLEGARVEARRFRLAADYFVNQTNDVLQKDLVGLGYYIGGFTFERSRQLDEALRFYSDAYAIMDGKVSFEERLVDLMRTTGTFTPLNDSEPLRKLAASARKQGTLPRAQYLEKYSDFDLLVLVQTGMVPYKVPQYLPVGAALTVAAAGGARAITNQEFNDVETLAARGLLTTVNMPVLVTDDVPNNPPYTLTIDHAIPQPSGHVDVASQVIQSWEKLAPSVAGSAITRSLTRVLASEGVNQAVQATGADSGLAGFAALALQGGLTIADTPDTRSWILLPSTLYLYRASLSDGRHTISLSLSTGKESRDVDAKKNGYEVINFSRFRQ